MKSKQNKKSKGKPLASRAAIRQRHSAAPFDLFTLNVGNTHTRMVGWSKRGYFDYLAWKTEGKRPGDWISFITKKGRPNAPVVLAGVVPDYKEELATLLRSAERHVLVFREDLIPCIEIVPAPPECVGDDRIAAALGALSMDDTRPWVVVDVGTAMTVNAVTPGKKGNPPRFEGGLIIPGSATSLFALSECTSQLPLLEPFSTSLNGPLDSRFIGRDTKEAMILGVWHAQIASAIALAKGQMLELGRGSRVALTGGGSEEGGFNLEFLRAFPAGKVLCFTELVHLGLFSMWKAREATKKI